MNNQWTDGYFTDLEYVDGYIAEMSPLLLNLNLTIAGIHCGNVHAITPLENLNYLELGFGKGSSLNIHAASNDGFFLGNDFNPNHALYAQEYANLSNAHISDLSFIHLYHELQERKQRFHIIVLHGVWSWISLENQRIILDIIAQFLHIGGIVYISYNTFPGWAKKHQLRELLFLYYQNLNGSPDVKITQAVRFLEELIHSHNHEHSSEELNFIEELKHKDPAYIAHEYLNKDWNCCYFHQMAQNMANIKCHFACSARILDHLDKSSIKQLDSLSLHNIILEEQAYDYKLNRQFRVDLFMRGKQTLSLQEGILKISNSNFILTKTPKDFKKTPTQTSNIFDTLIENVLIFMQTEHYRPKSGYEIMESCQLSFKDFITCLTIIIHQNLAMPCHNPTPAQKAKAQKFNLFLFHKQLYTSSSIFAASPLTGSGILISEVEQMCIIAFLQKCCDYSSLYAFISNLIIPQERMVFYKDKKAQNHNENMHYIQHTIHDFLNDKCHLFKALHIF